MEGKLVIGSKLVVMKAEKSSVLRTGL